MYSKQAAWRAARVAIAMGWLCAAGSSAGAADAAANGAAANAGELADTLARPATSVAKPGHAVLLGIAQAGKRLVAVGERGLIVVSDDEAKTWRQVPVSLSVSLTAVHFATPKKGWAVGHRGVILGTSDGGDSWTPQLDGRRFAEQVLAQAKTAAALPSATAEQSKQAMVEAEALVRDGADKPFLDLSFSDEQHGLAVGAYGLCARTEDGGATWSSCMAQLPNPKAAHLYAIARSGERVFIAGEQGLLLRSEDGGVQYAAVPGPYTTSLFCVAITDKGEVVLGSLRGKAFVSNAQGQNFEALPSEAQGSCAGSTRLNDGRLLLVNQLGQALLYDSNKRRLTLTPTPPMAPLSGLLQTRSGALVLVGARGVTALSAPASTLPAKP